MNRKILALAIALFSTNLVNPISAFATSAPEVPFSTNDLSILIPLKTSADGSSSLPQYVIHPGDSNSKILSIDNFHSVLNAAGDSQSFLNEKLRDEKNWYLVGIRYTPCTLFVGSTPACKEQMRFVFQSFLAERGMNGADDYAIHVVYNFADRSTAVRTPRLESFRKLKNQFSKFTLNQPITTNPVLKSVVGQKYFAALKSEVIVPHINTTHPSVITYIGLGYAKNDRTTSNSDHWVFLTGNVKAKAPYDWSLAPLNVGAPLTAEHMQLSEDEFGLRTDVQVTGKQINFISNAALDSDSLDGKTLTLAERFKVLDQRQTNDHNVACATCHIADAPVFPVLFSQDDRARTTQFIRAMRSMFNKKPRVSELLVDNQIHIGRIGFEVPAVRIFGYLDDKALISQRAVLDSALAVEQANNLLGLKPAVQCQTDEQRKKLLACVYLGDREAKLTDCIKKSCH